MENIVLIDDDRNITTSVAMALESEGFGVQAFHEGQAGLDAIAADAPDLVVLDIKMPRMDGMEVLTKLRAFSKNLPVIFLTSKDEELDEVLGLRMGADDYITKPFSQRLLIERIRALLRRRALQDTTGGPEQAEHATGLLLDDARHLCTWRGQAMNLTVTEYLLIKSLAEEPGVVKSRADLIAAAYEDQDYVDDRTIDSHVKRLRKKFKALDPDFDGIETIYGIGYKYQKK